jgi:glutaredoxin-related protein
MERTSRRHAERQTRLASSWASPKANVLAREVPMHMTEVRFKQFSNWPTIQQLYVMAT